MTDAKIEQLPEGVHHAGPNLLVQVRGASRSWGGVRLVTRVQQCRQGAAVFGLTVERITEDSRAIYRIPSVPV